jgi:serine/threonine protein kinase
LDHPNVIKCFDVLTSVNNCYIITEYCERGDLEKLLKKNKRFEERDITKFVYDIYKGLQYLASINIVHRDLKVANIFLDSKNNAKIADFGFAVKSSALFKDMSIGSPIYMSP